MDISKVIVGIILSLIGILFFYFNKDVGKGAYKFYKRFYTERNLVIMFRITGILLLIMGLIIIFID